MDLSRGLNEATECTSISRFTSTKNTRLTDADVCVKGQWGTQNNYVLLKPEKPHFFKVLPSKFTVHDMLAIPRKFVLNYGDELSTHVILKVPGGMKWKVEVVRFQGSINLAWRKFIEYYSLVGGDSIVFEYVKGHSEFRVLIFDKTATEIDYPFTLSNERPHPDEGRDAQHPIVILDDVPEERKNKKTRSNFSSANPTFKSLMRGSNVLNIDNLQVPHKFVKNLELGRHKLKLLVKNKVWNVQLDIFPKFGIFVEGWNKFARDNLLKVGDVCTFEMIDRETLLVSVSISRE